MVFGKGIFPAYNILTLTGVCVLLSVKWFIHFSDRIFKLSYDCEIRKGIFGISTDSIIVQFAASENIPNSHFDFAKSISVK